MRVGARPRLARVLAATCCLSGPLPCQGAGCHLRRQGAISDGSALFQTGAVVDRADGVPVPGGLQVVPPAVSGSGGEVDASAAASAQMAMAPDAETRTGGSGCGLGHDLLIASLDQPVMPGVEDFKSWTPLHTRAFWTSGTTALDERDPVTSLSAWGRLSQMMPILVVMVFGCHKLRQSLGRSTGSMSALGTAEVAVCLILYCVSGPAIILMNKHIMRAYKFDFPVFLASLGNALPMVVSRAAVAFGWKKLEVEHRSWDGYLKAVVPISILNFLAQTSGMYAFMFISVPMIQIMKSPVIVIVLLLAWLFANERVNTLLVVSVLVITIGVCVSVVFDNDSVVDDSGSVSHTLIGVTLMIVSCVFESGKTVISQVLIHNMPLFDVIYHTSPAYVFIATIFVGFMEANMISHYDFNGVVVGLLVANALTTGVIILSSFWLVKLAGAVTMKVVTQARSIGLVLCSVFFFGEFCSGTMYVGFTIALVGMFMFDYAKQVLEGDATKDGHGGRSEHGEAVKGEAQCRS